MAFPDQRILEHEETSVELRPIVKVVHNTELNGMVYSLVKDHRDVLELQLPGVVASYNTVSNSGRNLNRLAKRKDAEGYLAFLAGKLIGIATILGKKPDELPDPSAQLDYWLTKALEQRQAVGFAVGELLIARGFEVMDGAQPHAWLFEDGDSREPSSELRLLMDPVGAPILGYMAGDPDKNASGEVPARLYVARTIEPNRH